MGPASCVRDPLPTWVHQQGHVDSVPKYLATMSPSRQLLGPPHRVLPGLTPPLSVSPQRPPEGASEPQSSPAPLLPTALQGCHLPGVRAQVHRRPPQPCRPAPAPPPPAGLQLRGEPSCLGAFAWAVLAARRLLPLNLDTRATSTFLSLHIPTPRSPQRGLPRLSNGHHLDARNLLSLCHFLIKLSLPGISIANNSNDDRGRH